MSRGPGEHFAPNDVNVRDCVQEKRFGPGRGYRVPVAQPDYLGRDQGNKSRILCQPPVIERTQAAKEKRIAQMDAQIRALLKGRSG